MSNEAQDKLRKEFNKLKDDPEYAEHYRNNLLSFTRVLVGNKFSVGQYIDAVRFVGYRLMNKSMTESYKLTFPERYKKHVQTTAGTKGDVTSYATAYGRTKLVVMLLEQAMIPSYILNQDIYQEAINCQVSIIRDPYSSSRSKIDAANSLLTHLKMPETQKVELDIGVKDTGAIKELREATLELIEQQKKMVNVGGMNAKELAESRVIVGEFERVENG
jgi:hypothetical protein